MCTPVEKPNDLISGTAHYFDRLKLHGVTRVSVSVLENALPNLLTICAFYKVAGATTLLGFLFFKNNIGFTMKPEKYLYAWFDSLRRVDVVR